MSSATSEPRTCEYVDENGRTCGAKHHAKGLCETHYTRHRTGAKPRKPRPQCTIIENGVACGQPHCAKGMCRRHYYRDRLNALTAQGTCVLIENGVRCQNPVQYKQRQWCNAHYQLWLKNGDPLKRTNRWDNYSRTCTVAECTSKHLSRGYCSRHYASWLKYGDPLAAKTKRNITRVCKPQDHFATREHVAVTVLDSAVIEDWSTDDTEYLPLRACDASPKLIAELLQRKQARQQFIEAWTAATTIALAHVKGPGQDSWSSVFESLRQPIYEAYTNTGKRISLGYDEPDSGHRSDHVVIG